MAAPGKVARLIHPKDNSRSPNSNQDGAMDAKSSKRKCVSTACIPCRKRKSKCDGGMPVCSTCIAVYKTECSYDQDVDVRRKSVKKEGSVPSEANDSAATILHHLRTCAELESGEILSQIRSDESLDSIAEGIRKSATILRKSDTGGIESEFVEKQAVVLSGQARHYGVSSGLNLVPAEDNLSPEPQRGIVSPDFRGLDGWTRVTTDGGFIRHLIKLCFTWHNPFFAPIHEESFYHDFETGQSKYCSSLLVNAICAYGCHYSDLPASRENPDDPKTSGDHFFEETRRLLYENETSNLTTAQALMMMSSREASAGRDSNGFRYAGRSLRMILELGMHLPLMDPARPCSKGEMEARKTIFWAMFNCDTTWSVCIGRMSSLPRNAIGLERLSDQERRQDTWAPYTDDNYINQRPAQPAWPCDNHQFLYQMSTLSELVNDTVSMFFAPRERLTSRRVLDRYTKYKTWYKQLPDSLRLMETSPPHYYSLHLYYHVSVLHLFRPLLKMEFLNSSIEPRRICLEEAQNASSVMDRYRARFNMRCACLFLAHVQLTICTVQLIDFPVKDTVQYSPENQIAQTNVVHGLRDLSALSYNHPFAATAFKIICALAEKWNLWIPEEAFTMPPPISAGQSPMTPNNSHYVSNLPQAAIPISSGPISVPYHSRPHRTVPNPHMHEHNAHQNTEHQTHIYFQNNDMNMMASTFVPTPPASATRPSPILSSVSTATDFKPQSLGPHYQQVTQATRFQPQPTAPSTLRDNFFWSPFPGQGIPLMGSNAPFTSPMDVSTMTTAMDQWDQLARDGFRLHDMWGQDPVHGTALGSVQPSMQSYQEQQHNQLVDNVANRIAGQSLAGHPHGGRQDGYGQQWWEAR